MTTYFETNRKEECYGCKACEQICPKKSIKMKCDREGFWYPKINIDTCVKCNLCRKVCPYNEKSFKINTLNKTNLSLFRYSLAFIYDFCISL